MPFEEQQTGHYGEATGTGVESHAIATMPPYGAFWHQVDASDGWFSLKTAHLASQVGGGTSSQDKYLKFKTDEQRVVSAASCPHGTTECLWKYQDSGKEPNLGWTKYHIISKSGNKRLTHDLKVVGHGSVNGDQDEWQLLEPELFLSLQHQGRINGSDASGFLIVPPEETDDAAAGAASSLDRGAKPKRASDVKARAAKEVAKQSSHHLMRAEATGQKRTVTIKATSP